MPTTGDEPQANKRYPISPEIPSSDGRGEGKMIPGPRMGHRYIYYRVYSKSGLLESNNPIFSNDRFISRILSRSVAPPHTSVSLKRYLCTIEGFDPDTSGQCSLYLSLSQQTPVEDTTRLSLRGTSGPGGSDLEPMALVVDTPTAEKRKAPEITLKKTLLERDEIQRIRYVYYRVYTKNGEVLSKTSYHDDDPFLGRIDILSVAPPHSVSSLKFRLIKAEEISGSDFQLFEDEGGETVMNDGDPINLLADTYPGIIEDEPIAIVYKAQKDSTDSIPPGFSKQLKAKYRSSWGSADSMWHSAETGEVFQTDGVLMTKAFGSNGDYLCYIAINSSGKKASIRDEYVTFI